MCYRQMNGDVKQFCFHSFNFGYCFLYGSRNLQVNLRRKRNTGPKKNFARVLLTCGKFSGRKNAFGVKFRLRKYQLQKMCLTSQTGSVIGCVSH